MCGIHKLTKEVLEELKYKDKQVNFRNDFWLVIKKYNPEKKVEILHTSNLSPEKEAYIDRIPYLTSDWIRHFLRTFKDELGENPEYANYAKLHDEKLQRMQTRIANNEPMTPEDDISEAQLGFIMRMILFIPKTQAEVLCQRWLDGLTSMYDSKLEQVLEELHEVAKKLKNKEI